MSDNKSKVIVVGGGPAGLAAAHALSQANIDYIVLEHRSSVKVDVGASLVLWPQGLRILAQLGLLGSLQAIGTGLGLSTTITLDGHKYKETWATLEIEKNHGMRPMIFQRAQIIDVLYDSLSDRDKSCVLMGKKVTDIVTNEHGVEVSCKDGSIHHGSIVIGADGAHSKVREIMRKLSIKSSSPDINDEHPYLSEYRALWGNFPRQPGSQTGETVEIHGKDVSLQYLIGHDRAWIFIYERLETPTRDRVSYSQQDVEALAARHGHLPINEHLKVNDVFPERYKAGMTNLEEGIVKHWSGDRIVLIGDACHKLTPNQGLGFNNAIQDVAALVNELHSIVPGRTPSTDDLTSAFRRYQDSRMCVLQKDFDGSAGFTRMAAWRTSALRILDRYILSSIPNGDDLMINYVLCKVVSKAPALNFVESGEPFRGRVPWQYPAKLSSTKPVV